MEKFMRNLMLVLIATFSVCLASCGDDDNDGPNNAHPLTGYWIGNLNGEQFAYRFNADGTGTSQALPDGRLDKFTDYKVEGGHLYLLWEDDDEYDDKGSIRVKTGTFELNLYDDGEWTTFTRQ